MQFTDDLIHALPRFLEDEWGASFMEYLLVCSIIATLCFLVVLALGKEP